MQIVEKSAFSNSTRAADLLGMKMIFNIFPKLLKIL